MTKFLSFVVLSMLAFSVNAAGTTYKCFDPVKDKDMKHPYYSDRMQMAPMVCSELWVKKAKPIVQNQVGEAGGQGQSAGSGGSVTENPLVAEANKAEAAETEKPKEGAKDKKESAEDVAKRAEQDKAQKESNCKGAKSIVETYKQGRVKRTDENGQTKYLDEQEVADGLAQAQKDVEYWCNAK